MEGIILLLKVSENLIDQYDEYTIDKIKLEINSKVNEYFVILSSVIQEMDKKKKENPFDSIKDFLNYDIKVNNSAIIIQKYFRRYYTNKVIIKKLLKIDKVVIIQKNIRKRLDQNKYNFLLKKIIFIQYKFRYYIKRKNKIKELLNQLIKIGFKPNNKSSKEIVFEDKGIYYTKKPPEQFICSISQELMEEPVVTVNGYSYEKTEIMNWFKSKKKNRLIEPRDGRIIKNKNLSPNIDLKISIQEWKKKYQIKK